MTQQKEFNSKRRLEAIQKLVETIESLNIDDTDVPLELISIIRSAVQVVDPSIGIRFRYGFCSYFE
jgi:hypothetical protein